MINLTKRIITTILYGRGILFKKIPGPPVKQNGYNNLDVVLKRYRYSSDTSYKDFVGSGPARDLLYFLKGECSNYKNEFKKINKVLDVGCGNGLYSKFFKDSKLFSDKIKYFGTEINSFFIELCREKYPEGKFILTSADELNFKNKVFDLVLCSGTLHYTLNKWKKSLQEMARVSQKYLLITRFPLTKYNKTFYVHQSVWNKLQTEDHYFIVINQFEFEKYISELGFLIMNKDYSSEEFYIEGITDKIILSEYLLEKK